MFVMDDSPENRQSLARTAANILGGEKLIRPRPATPPENRDARDLCRGHLTKRENRTLSLTSAIQPR